MRKLRADQKGQASILVALAFIGLLAFSALAIDGGNAYLKRRDAQNAADAAVVSSARELYRVLEEPEKIPYILGGGDPEDYLLGMVVDAVQRNDTPDTNDNVDDLYNDNVIAWYLDENGDRIWELGAYHGVPGDARGIEAEVTIPFDTFLAYLIGREELAATTNAGAIFYDWNTSIHGAIHADADCEPQTLSLTGSHQEIIGGIHSNSCLQINGNNSDPSIIVGAAEFYTGCLDHSGWSGVVFDPAGTAETAPVSKVYDLYYTRDFDKFAVGNMYASDVITDDVNMYHYYADNGNGTAPRMDFLPGLHYSADPDGIVIGHQHGTSVLTITVVTEGLIDIKDDTRFTPFVAGLLFFSSEGERGCPCTTTAIKMSGSRFSWEGLIYAPNGLVSMSASDNSSFSGSIVAWCVDLSGSQIEIRYNPKYDPLVPPKIVLVF